MPVQFSVFYDFRNPRGEPNTRLYRETLEQIQAMDRLGFDGVFISEHHFLEDGYCPSALALAAAIAGRTSRLRIGTYVLLLPLHNPVRVAEDAAIADILSDGRFVLGVSAGYRAGDFTGFNLRRSHRGALLEEGLQVIRAAWTEEEFSFTGKHYQFRNLRVAPKPVQKPHPPIWVGGQADAAVDRAARLGDGYLLPSLHAVGSYHRYLEALQRCGKRREEVFVGVNLVAYVGETAEQAWKEAREPLLYQQNLYAQWHLEAVGPQLAAGGRRVVNTPEELPRQDYIIGDPDECVARLRALQARLPVDGVFFCGNLPGLDREKGLKSLELFASRVMPHFR